jgi:hypothetical protein
MSWHHPELYFFFFLLAGLATFLAIIYECIQKFRRKPPVVEPPKHPPSAPNYLENAKPLDGLQRDRPRPTEAGKQATEQFSRLCENVEDLPPKDQASRVHDHFGIFGGARPAPRRGRARK